MRFRMVAAGITGLIFAAFVSACGVGAPIANPSPPAAPIVPDAALQEACPERLILTGSPRGHRVLRALPAIDSYVVCSTPGLSALEDAEPDTVRNWIPEAPFAAPGAGVELQADSWVQWHLDKVQAPAAWARSTGAGVTVYVLDTAGDCGAMDMRCGTGRNYAGGSSADGHGHGSHVGSTIGEALNGRRGVGVAHDVTVTFFKVLGDSGSGSVSGIAQAITDAADLCPGRCLISMSLGSSQASAALQRATDYAIAKGVPVFAAAGNHGTSAPGYPGCNAGVVGVGATDSADKRASFSAYGSCVDIAGPGVSITASKPDGSPWTISGTSMATPNVSAVAALVLALGAAPADVEGILERTADDIGGQQLGAGRVNALAAVNAVNPAPVPSSDPGDKPTATPADGVTPGPAPATPVPPVPPATGEPGRACTARGLLFEGASVRLGPVLVPCETGG